MTDISAEIDAGFAQLDALLQPERERKAESFRQLQAIVANLDYGTPAEPEEDERPLRREPERGAPVAPVIDYAPRSAGDRPGGPYLERLIREASRHRPW